MRLPFIGNIEKKKKTIGVFKGINQGEVIAENEFADMKNMSSNLYPAIGPRSPRGEVIYTMEKANGLYYNNALAWVDGETFYYNKEPVGTVKDSEKQMVSMGAYIVIFPDKKVYNTNSGEWSDMEKTWIQEKTATFAPTISGSTFIKISATGIGKNFSKGDGVTISGCTNNEFNKSVVIQHLEENAIVVIGDLTEQFTQDSGLRIERKVPDLDFITESENRLWGCSSKNHEVYASKLGDPLNWNCFEGISTDSYAATVGSDGDFTGATTHLGYVLFFKEHMIHKVYGNKPSNIQINQYPARGVKKGCEKSLCIVNETLFYASCEGICVYDGGMPTLISQNLKNSYKAAVAGQENGKYYLSVCKNEWELYVYDPEYGLWHREDESRFKATCYGDGKLYYINEENELRRAADSENGKEAISWFMESGDQEEGSLDKKRLHKLQFFMELEPGTVVELDVSYDNEPLWERIKTFTAPKKQVFMLHLKPRRCTKYRWKLTGYGEAKLLGLSKEYVTGTGR